MFLLGKHMNVHVKYSISTGAFSVLGMYNMWRYPWAIIKNSCSLMQHWWWGVCSANFSNTLMPHLHIFRHLYGWWLDHFPQQSLAMLDNAPLVKNFSQYPNYTFSGTTWNNFLLSNCLLLEKRLNPNSLHPPFSGCREWECSPWASLSPGLTPPVPFSCPSSDLSSRAFTNFVALLWMGWPQVSGTGNNHSLLWIWEAQGH